MKARYSGGYVGILMLLITCLIIALLAWRSDLFIAKPAASTAAGGQTPVDIQAPTSVQGQVQAVQKARDAASMLEKQNQIQTQGL